MVTLNLKRDLAYLLDATGNTVEKQAFLKALDPVIKKFENTSKNPEFSNFDTFASELYTGADWLSYKSGLGTPAFDSIMARARALLESPVSVGEQEGNTLIYDFANGSDIELTFKTGGYESFYISARTYLATPDDIDFSLIAGAAHVTVLNQDAKAFPVDIFQEVFGFALTTSDIDTLNCIMPGLSRSQWRSILVDLNTLHPRIRQVKKECPGNNRKLTDSIISNLQALYSKVSQLITRRPELDLFSAATLHLRLPGTSVENMKRWLEKCSNAKLDPLKTLPVLRGIHAKDIDIILDLAVRNRVDYLARLGNYGLQHGGDTGVTKDGLKEHARYAQNLATTMAYNVVTPSFLVTIAAIETQGRSWAKGGLVQVLDESVWEAAMTEKSKHPAVHKKTDGTSRNNYRNALFASAYYFDGDCCDVRYNPSCSLGLTIAAYNRGAPKMYYGDKAYINDPDAELPPITQDYLAKYLIMNAAIEKNWDGLVAGNMSMKEAANLA